MSANASFQCPNCSKTIHVEIRQAGQGVACRGCKQSVEVPTMRVLRQLQAESDEPVAAKPKIEPPSVVRRSMFAIGMAVFLIFAAAGGGMFVWASKLQTEFPAEELNKINRQAFAKIDNADIDEFWSIWNDQVLSQPPNVWAPSFYVRNADIASVRRTIGWSLMGVALLGVASMVSSIFVRR